MIDYDELLEILELDSPADFQYFENLADLLECEEEISYEAIYLLLKQTNGETLAELISQYFEDLLENVPDDSAMADSLIHTIGLSLSGLANSINDSEQDAILFCEEFVKFKEWYMHQNNVNIKALSGEKAGNIFKVSPAMAITFSRLEKLSGDKYEYDFEPCLDYEIKDYAMKFKDVIYDDENEIDMRYEDMAEEDLLKGGFVYDDEFKE